ncbi:hypothetical protein [Almyronema epifaneia]|uniref:Uncharacterized protein n=1 Tax=Almyronema epifaneia S1 TaxID=2991925 RepID=A0ABW6IK85_9CYAN
MKAKTVTTSARQVPNEPRKYATPKSKPWGAKLLSPFAWGAKSLAWLISSEKNGGARFVLYGMSLYCFALSAETIYLSLPKSEAAEAAGIESLRFLPKPSIADDANIKYLLPLPTIGNTLKRIANFTVGNLVPFYPKHQIQPQWTIWGDPNWYLAFAIAALIGLIEARVIRRTADSWERKQKKFFKYNARRVPDLNPNAVIAASLAQKELQAEGAGNYGMVALVIIVTYGTEFYAFLRSLRGLEIGLFTTVIYGLLNVVGFEILWALAEDPEADEV